MAFIELYENGRRLGKFDLPRELRGRAGHEFRIARFVRGGGNGIVFEATPLGALGLQIDVCAVKLLRQQDQTRLDRFENEVRIMAMLQHERIAMFFDSGTITLEGGFEVPWAAMELGDENLRREVDLRGPLAPRDLLSVALQIVEALSYMHASGIIHRDIKPDNFVRDGEVPDSIKMIDFGIAKLVEEDVSGRPMDQFTQHLEFVGPVFFASPELIAYAKDKSRAVDARSDLFQFGKLLWFLATGHISAGIPSRKDCPLDGALHSLVMELLPDDPDDRLQTADATAARLRAIGA